MERGGDDASIERHEEISDSERDDDEELVSRRLPLVHGGGGGFPRSRYGGEEVSSLDCGVLEPDSDPWGRFCHASGTASVAGDEFMVRLPFFFVSVKGYSVVVSAADL